MNTPAVKRRGRRPKRDEAQFHDALLDHALSRFMVEGYHATTMAALAASFGTAKATLYRNYNSKAGLLRAAMERGVPAISEPLGRVAADLDRPVGDVLLDFGRIIQAYHADPTIRAMWRAVSEARDDVGAMLDDAVEQHRIALAPIENYLLRLQSAGRAGDFDPWIAAASFAEIVSGGLSAFLVHPPPHGTRPKLLEFSVHLFVAGLDLTRD
jgi:AcrR family transcriptional regulator